MTQGGYSPELLFMLCYQSFLLCENGRERPCLSHSKHGSKPRFGWVKDSHHFWSSTAFLIMPYHPTIKAVVNDLFIRYEDPSLWKVTSGDPQPSEQGFLIWWLTLTRLPSPHLWVTLSWLHCSWIWHPRGGHGVRPNTVCDWSQALRWRLVEPKFGG